VSTTVPRRVSTVTIWSPAVCPPTRWTRIPGHTSWSPSTIQDLVRVVQGHQSRQGIDVGEAAKGRDPAEGPRPERDFLSLEGIRISRALARVPCLAPTFTSFLPGPRRLSRDAPLA
jgi:hypothetical protein